MRFAGLIGVLVVMALAGALVVAPAQAGSAITLKDNAFSPRSLTVKKGARVTFVWAGKNPHDVVGSGAASFHSKIQKKGSFSVTLRKKGVVRLLCQVHPGMTAKITVK